MAATRTQIYLSESQRDRIDAVRDETGASLAEVIRLAVDEYLDRQRTADLQAALDATFGIAPDFEVPPRSEWSRRSDLRDA